MNEVSFAQIEGFRDNLEMMDQYNLWIKWNDEAGVKMSKQND